MRRIAPNSSNFLKSHELIRRNEKGSSRFRDPVGKCFELRFPKSRKMMTGRLKAADHWWYPTSKSSSPDSLLAQCQLLTTENGLPNDGSHRLDFHPTLNR